jgi:hypothetical protein
MKHNCTFLGRYDMKMGHLGHFGKISRPLVIIQMNFGSRSPCWFLRFKEPNVLDGIRVLKTQAMLFPSITRMRFAYISRTIEKKAKSIERSFPLCWLTVWDDEISAKLWWEGNNIRDEHLERKQANWSAVWIIEDDKANFKGSLMMAFVFCS